jgi:hypothetical protein
MINKHRPITVSRFQIKRRIKTKLSKEALLYSQHERKVSVQRILHTIKGTISLLELRSDRQTLHMRTHALLYAAKPVIQRLR